LATSAHLTLAEDGADADLVLRSADEPFDGAPVDVTVSGGVVIVACHANPPSPHVWEALGRIVNRALAS
jgi:hypothetical protein